MKRTAIAAALVAALALAATAAGDGALSLSAGDAKFPDRSFALTLPQRLSLSRSSVSVREDGRPVPGLRVIPLNAGRERFGVALVLDASGSMRGRSIQQATAAAREFSGQRPPGQPLALLSFNNRTNVELPLTTEPSRIEGALAAPPQAQGATRAYDAVAKAVQMIRDQKLAGGAIVLLSDGRITRTSTSADQVVAAATGAHVIIYTVGLRSPQFSPAELRSLAARTGGSYTEAATALDLGAIYRKLGVRLASAYLLHYRSRASEGQRVAVDARVKGVPGIATASYVVPVVQPTGSGERATVRGFWSSTAAVVTASLLVALFLALVVGGVLRRGRRAPLLARVGLFVRLPEEESRRRPTEALAERFVAGTARSVRGAGWWASFSEEVDVAQIETDPAQIAAATALGTIVTGILLAVIGNEPLLAIAALAVPFSVRMYVGNRADKQRELFSEQLSDDLAIIASAMRAGHSFVGALTAVAEEAAEPSRREFQRVVADEQLGAPLDEAVEVVVRRMRSPDLEQVALLAVLQRETGSSAAEMLDRVIETIRERQMLRRMVRALTAQGRMSRWVLTIVPVFLLVFLSLTNKTYVDSLYHTTAGNLMLALGAVMLTAGSLIIKRLVEFEI